MELTRSVAIATLTLAFVSPGGALALQIELPPERSRLGSEGSTAVERTAASAQLTPLPLRAAHDGKLRRFGGEGADDPCRSANRVAGSERAQSCWILELISGDVDPEQPLALP